MSKTKSVDLEKDYNKKITIMIWNDKYLQSLGLTVYLYLFIYYFQILLNFINYFIFILVVIVL